MTDRELADKWREAGRNSLRVLPVALIVFIALSLVVYFEKLYRSEDAFLSGVLMGTLGYWAILEIMTIARSGVLRSGYENRGERGPE